MRADRRRAARRRYRRRLVVAAVLVAVCVWWVLADPVPGGPTLFSVSATHGADVADIATIPVLAFALWLAWPRSRQRRSKGPVASAAPAALVPAPGDLLPGSVPPAPADVVHVLVVCSANRCRSPMAAALLAQRLGARGVPAVVRSAGTTAVPGLPATVEAAAAVPGLDDHRSETLTREMIERADLILAMTRHHAREVVVMCPEAFTKTFTLLDLAARVRSAAPREAGESFAVWLTRIGAGRGFAALTGTGERDDVPDPIGEDAAVFARTATLLDEALDTAVCAAWPTSPSGSQAAGLAG